MRRTLLALLLIAAVLAGACDSKTLTRRKAKSLLTGAYTLRGRQVSAVLRLNQRIQFNPSVDPRWVALSASGAQRETQNRENIIRVFETLGLVVHRPLTDGDLQPATDAPLFNQPLDTLRGYAKYGLPAGVAVLTEQGRRQASTWTCKDATHDINGRLEYVAYLRCEVPVTQGLEIVVTDIRVDGVWADITYIPRYAPNTIGTQFLKSYKRTSADDDPEYVELLDRLRGMSQRARAQGDTSGWSLVR